MCIGASFATMEIEIDLATILQRFRFELPEHAESTRAWPSRWRRPAVCRCTFAGASDKIANPAAVLGKIRDFVRLPS